MVWSPREPVRPLSGLPRVLNRDYIIAWVRRFVKGVREKTFFIFSQKGVDKRAEVCYNGIVRKGLTL